MATANSFWSPCLLQARQGWPWASPLSLRPGAVRGCATSLPAAGAAGAPAGRGGSQWGTCPLQPSLGKCSCANGEGVGAGQPNPSRPRKQHFPGDLCLPHSLPTSPKLLEPAGRVAVTSAGLVLTSNHNSLILRH